MWQGPLWSWSWSYGSLIYNYMCNQCLSPLMLWGRISFRRGVLNTTLCDKVFQWLVAGQWFSPGTPVSSINKTDRHDITEILLQVAVNTLTPTLSLNVWQVSRGTWQNDLLTSIGRKRGRETLTLEVGIGVRTHIRDVGLVVTTVLHMIWRSMMNVRFFTWREAKQDVVRKKQNRKKDTANF